MSEETVVEVEEIAPTVEDGEFYVSQIAPVEVVEVVKPEAKEPAEGDEETSDDAESDEYTYQTGPNVTVNPKQISEIARRILVERLKDTEYNTSAIKTATSQISFLIREQVKRLHLDRYRIIVQVTVGEKCEQDITMNFLYLWKPEFDHYAVAKYETSAFFSAVLVFLIYKQ